MLSLVGCNPSMPTSSVMFRTVHVARVCRFVVVRKLHKYLRQHQVRQTCLSQVLSLLDDAKNGRVGSYNPPSVPVPSSPLSPPSATALFAISIVRAPASCWWLVQLYSRAMYGKHRCAPNSKLCCAAAAVTSEGAVATLRELPNQTALRCCLPETGMGTEMEWSSTDEWMVSSRYRVICSVNFPHHALLTAAHLLAPQSKDVAEIPQFYFPGGPRIPDTVKRDMQTKLDHCFASHPEGLTIPAVKDLIREVNDCSKFPCQRFITCQQRFAMVRLRVQSWAIGAGVPAPDSTGVSPLLKARTARGVHRDAARCALMDCSAECDAGVHARLLLHTHTILADASGYNSTHHVVS